MKRIVMTLLVGAALVHQGYSQNINWRSLGEDDRNIVQFIAGYDFGAVAQVGYARAFTLVRPAIFGMDYSFPMGRDLTDDFKVRLGLQIEALQIEGFSATIKLYGNFRRYQTQLVRIASFGSDFAAVAGYYASTWYAAGEFGFDKAIATELRHSDIMRASFPAIRDGWYVPTAGNFYYGIQGGKTIGGTLELSLRLGATNAQDNDDNAAMPMYLQVGLGIRF